MSKIAINCAFFQPQGGGIKEYVYNLISNLQLLDHNNEYIIYVLKDQYQYAKNSLNCKFIIKTIPFNSNGLINTILRSCFESIFWKKEEKCEKWDIFHSPFFHAPKPKKAKLIITVHDLRFFRYPKTYTFMRYQFLKRAVKKSIINADRIISISQFTKDEIIFAYGIDDSKITVIPEAINHDNFLIKELSLEDSFLVSKLKNYNIILSVGHLEPRKNYDRLIRAFSKIKHKLNSETKLIIVGKKGHNYKSTIDLIQKTDDVIYLNFVSSEVLNWLYSHAYLFVFPSIYEGFGFPPLEAAIHGTISAVSNISSIPEVCGDAVLYFNPFNENEISNALLIGMQDQSLRASLKEKLDSQIAKFSWEKNVIDTIKLYNTL